MWWRKHHGSQSQSPAAFVDKAAQKALETREAWVREASPELSGEAQADLLALRDESAEEVRRRCLRC